MLTMSQFGEGTKSTSDTLADAGTSVDVGNQVQTSQHGIFPQTRVGLARLEEGKKTKHREKRVIAQQGKESKSNISVAACFVLEAFTILSGFVLMGPFFRRFLHLEGVFCIGIGRPVFCTILLTL